MDLVDLTLATPAENLALDEALLDEAEQTVEPRETLRLWESPQVFVVLGRNSQPAEVNLAACRKQNVPVLRRSSGGCAVVAGPGCLMYALVLSYELHPELRALDRAHAFVLDRITSALRPHAAHVQRQGTSDLALGEIKFSGNSLRCRRRALLYHGTILYNFDLPLVGELLPMPPREPDYRQHRGHEAFVGNLPLSREVVRQAVIGAWQAVPTATAWPRERTRQIAAEKVAEALR